MATVNSDLYAEAPVVRARMSVPPEAIDALLDATCLEEPAPGSYQNLETGEAWLEAFGVDRAALGRTAAAMRAAAAAQGLGEREVSFEALPREDWAESWKRFFHVLRVSPRVTVRPPWEPYEPERPDEVVVTIEPGMSFGTGLHGTTQACLRFLEALADEAAPAVRAGGAPLSVADLGCGSGILSIAALRLGFAPVRGVDYDVAAVRVSAENAAENGASEASFSVCDVTVDPIPRADVVVANILAPILIAGAARISAAVSDRSGAALVLSGILEGQYPRVRAAYEACGMREERTIAIGEWTSGLFRRA